jgi:7-cyano-7-deazaguanine synthase in queuosine biosynthesis
MRDDQGNKVVDMEQIKKKIVEDFYKSLLRQSSHIFIDSKTTKVRNLLRNQIYVLQRREMKKEVTFVEIRNTNFAMKSSKASGPNGYSAGF